MRDHILIIDDDVNFCESLRDILAENNLENVDVLHDGASLSALKGPPPDLIILDVMMPHLGGYSMINTINRDPQFNKTSIVVVTGKKELESSFDEDEKVEACFIKPIQIPTFLKKISALTSKAEFESCSRQSEAKPNKTENKASYKDGSPAGKLVQLTEENTALKAMVRQSDERFYNLVGKSLDGIVVFDDEGKTIYANPEAEKIFGKPIAKLLGEKLNIPAEVEIRKDLVLAFDQDDPLYIESKVTDVIWEGKKAHLASLRDITVRKQYELRVEALNRELEQERNSLKRINKELDAFSYTVSHDLKSALRTIIVTSQFILEDNQDVLDENSLSHINRVISSGRKLNELMSSLLKFARIDQGTQRKVDVNSKDIVDDAIMMVEADRVAKNALINIEGTLPKISCYKDQILQVFLNLISNSLKYMPEGKVPDIKIGCIKKDGVDTFYIKDNGIGIEETQFSKIFEIFSRLHSDETDFKGTGIGLTTVKKVVELHGGRINVESAVGVGTIFYFTLQGAP